MSVPMSVSKMTGAVIWPRAGPARPRTHRSQPRIAARIVPPNDVRASIDNAPPQAVGRAPGGAGNLPAMDAENLHYEDMDSPVGRLRLIASDDSLVGIWFE